MTASVNIYINRGGHFKRTASVNRFCEAVLLTVLVNKKMTASVNRRH